MCNLNLFIMKCISIYFVTLLLLMSGCESGRRFILKDLRCENLENPVAIDNTHPHFSWKIETDACWIKAKPIYGIQVRWNRPLP